MKKKMIALFSLLLCVCLLTPAVAAGVSPRTAGHDYTVDSPYKDVDWDTWKALKAALHTHTIASDGAANIDETIESHYALGFDILAITDHMVNAAPWNEKPQTVPLMTLVKQDRNQGRELSVLTDERYAEILSGAGRAGRGMLDVPLGAELNGAVPSNSHINGLFVDYGQGLIGVDGDYETPAREVDRLGGVTFLNHIGNVTQAWDKRDPEISRSPRWVNKFARIFLDTKSCVAMDINSGTDAHTGYDRILWDEVLQKTIPNGRNVSCITFSDSHGLDQNDRAFTMMMEPENTVEALRTCLETGAYFGVSRHAVVELGESFEGAGPTPIVTRIDVDQSADTIALSGENYDAITWVSNGEIIASGETLALDEVSGSLGCYVRAYLTGPGGICYTQAFVITAPDIDYGTPYVPAVTYDSSFFLRKLVTFLDDFLFSKSAVVALFKHLALGI